MNTPELNPNVSDAKLISEFRCELVKRYPELPWTEDEGIYCSMEALYRYAVDLCLERKLPEIRDCFEFVDSFYCRSKNELQKAINVSFLEWFAYNRLTEDEFRDLMPSTLYQGYIDMCEYMTELAKKSAAKDAPDVLAEPSDASKDRASRSGNGNSTVGDR